MSAGAAGIGTRIHAALVHLPIAAWTTAAVLQLGAPFRDGAALWGIEVAAAMHVLLWSGLALAFPAAVAGMLEFSRLPEDERVIATAERHLYLMSGAIVCFLLLALAHPRTGALALPAALEYALSALGLILMVAGGHMGGRLVVLRQRAIAVRRNTARPT